LVLVGLLVQLAEVAMALKAEILYFLPLHLLVVVLVLKQMVQVEMVVQVVAVEMLVHQHILEEQEIHPQLLHLKVTMVVQLLQTLVEVVEVHSQ
jgi:hypothetical protein